jgi:hypothetical protein
MRIRSLTYEDALYLLAFGLALGFRLFSLGAAPLTDAEANWALQALDLSRGSQPQIGAQAAYVLLTGLGFTIFSATNFLARLLPALAGSLLVLLPNILRPLLGDTTRLRWSGLLLAFGLALDPGLLALSRTAGSLMPALAFSMLALAFFARRKMIWAGIATGLALLSGPALLHGTLILALGWGMYRLVEKQNQRSAQKDSSEHNPSWQMPPLERSGLRSALFALLGTLLVVGMLFLRVPQGLGALAATLPAYLQSWISPGGVPALRLPVALLVYQPLVVVLALLAIRRAWQSPWVGKPIERLAVGLSLWVLVGLFVTMLYPARLVGDLAWVLVPLWGLAALELPHYLPGRESRSVRLVAGGLAALLCILSAVVWVNLLNLSRYQTTLLLFWLMTGGVAVLGIISTIMVAAGWSTISARLGLVWSLCLVLGLGMFSETWGVTNLRPQATPELWSTPPAAGQADQLIESLQELSQTTTGRKTEIEIVLLEDSPSLRWALRQFPHLTVADGLAASDAPAIVITSKTQQTPTLAQRYRGQDLVWRIYPAWQSVLPSNLAAWLAFRQAPMATQQIILWARVDLFPGGLEALPSENQPEIP